MERSLPSRRPTPAVNPRWMYLSNATLQKLRCPPTTEQHSPWRVEWSWAIRSGGRSDNVEVFRNGGLRKHRVGIGHGCRPTRSDRGHFATQRPAAFGGADESRRDSRLYRVLARNERCVPAKPGGSS